MNVPRPNRRLSQTLSLDALDAFDAVARHASFTRAARELNVTQSAVSHRVKALEEQLGYALLTRSTREVTLTENGAILARGVAVGLGAIDDALGDIEDRQRGATLALSCSPSFAIRWLVRKLHGFRALHPEIQVRISAADELASPGHAGIDVCIRFGAGRYPGLSVTRLTHEEIFPVASPALLARTPLRRQSDLGRHQLIHHDVMRDHPAHVPWERWLSPRVRATVDCDSGIHVSHAHMALEAAAAGQGIALGRTTLVAEDLTAGRLVAPLRKRVPSGLAYWFLCAPGAKRETPVARLRAWLMAELSAH